MELDHKQKADLANLYHTARILYSKNYDCLLYAKREFHKLYPEVSETWAYKHLTRMQEWRV